MKYARNRLILLLIVAFLLASFTACTSPKQASYLPEKYLDWTVADASITMTGSQVVKSEIIVTLEGKSIQLDYENGQLKECDAISQKTSQISGSDLIKFLESSSKEFGEIAQSDTVLIGITGDLNIIDALILGEEIYLYQTDGGKLKKTSYDGAGGIAWGSIMDGNYKQVYTVILR